MTEPTATIRVLLAEDSYVVREGVRALVETQASLELVGTCGDLPVPPACSPAARTEGRSCWDTCTGITPRDCRSSGPVTRTALPCGR